jgi:agmatine deiminase
MSSRRYRASVPAALGYHMPAEWEPHASTWMAWPHFKGDWPGKFEPIPWVYAEIIRNLARHERVDLIVNSRFAERHAREVLEKADALSENVIFHYWRTDRVWTRDSGCIFLSSSEEGSQLHALHFQFNAWAKYSNYKFDQKIGRRMAQAAGARVVQPLWGEERVVLEGGSIDVNGNGSLLTTEECLLSPEQQRNARMDRAAYEKLFAEYLGAPTVIWLDHGIAGDDTHGHVDDIARFAGPETIVAMVEPNAQDENYSALQENLGRLKAARNRDGERFEIVEIPMPRAVIFAGRRLPASYANFYIGNGVVLVPVFNDPSDRIALDILAAQFPTREIVPVYSGDLIWGFGAIHCMTQQEPGSPGNL